jgi:hypothetical protein
VLEGEVAARAVRHSAQSFLHLDEIELVGVLGAHALEQSGERQALPLARYALPARLHGEEPRDAGGDSGEVGGIVEHDEARRAEAGPDAPHSLVAHGRVEPVGGDKRIGDA